jgi:hypothetical protein
MVHNRCCASLSTSFSNGGTRRLRSHPAAAKRGASPPGRQLGSTETNLMESRRPTRAPQGHQTCLCDPPRVVLRARMGSWPACSTARHICSSHIYLWWSPRPSCSVPEVGPNACRFEQRPRRRLARLNCAACDSRGRRPRGWRVGPFTAHFEADCRPFSDDRGLRGPPRPEDKLAVTAVTNRQGQLSGSTTASVVKETQTVHGS